MDEGLQAISLRPVDFKSTNNLTIDNHNARKKNTATYQIYDLSFIILFATLLQTQKTSSTVLENCVVQVCCVSTITHVFLKQS